MAKLNEALQENPRYLPALELRALIEVSQNQIDSAMKDYNQIIKQDPKNVPALINRASINGLLGHTQEAFRDFDAAIRIDSKADSAYANRSILDYTTADYKQGVADSSRAIELNKESATAYLNRAYCYEELGQTNNAMSDLSTVIGLAGGNRALLFEACFERGNLSMSQKKYDKAIEDYTIALRMEPRFVGLYNNRSIAYRAVRKTDLADADLLRVYRIMPEVAYLCRNRTILELSSKHTAQVLQNLMTSVPLSMMPKKRIAASFEKPIFEKAVAIYTPILAKTPDDLAIVFNMATATFCLQQFETAAQQYQKFISIGGRESTTFDSALVLCYSALSLIGKNDAARKILTEYGESRKTTNKWFGTVHQFLSGKLKEKDFLACAHSEREKTTAHCIAGLQSVTHHDKAAAEAAFQWVEKNGDQLSDEYWIALSQLAALHSAH